MHKFKCPEGHEFEAKRNFYAHCPVCGKNARRVYDGEDNSRSSGEKETKETKETSENPEGAKEKTESGTDSKQDNKPTGNDEEGSKETKQDWPNSSKPRRVKVTRETPKKEDTTDDKGKSPASSPAKKVKIKRGATPKVVKKIVTTRDRKMNKEKKEERATQWTRVKSFKIF